MSNDQIAYTAIVVFILIFVGAVHAIQQDRKRQAEKFKKDGEEFMKSIRENKAGEKWKSK